MTDLKPGPTLSTPGEATPETPKRSLMGSEVMRGLRHSRLLSLLLANVVLIVVTTWQDSNFLRAETFRVILDNMAPGAMLIPFTVMLLAAGRFDLSMDGAAVLGGVVAGLCMSDWGVSPVFAVVFGLAVGGFIGLANGVSVEYFEMNPLITTLATWWIASGLALGFTKGQSPGRFSEGFLAIGRTRILGLLPAVWYAVAASILGAMVFVLARAGRHIRATGGNREAARLNGVQTRPIGLRLYILSGLAASSVGIVFAARLGSSSASAFDGLTLDVIAGAVIGGAALTGGRGSIVGGLLGLFLLKTMTSASVFLGISPFWQRAITGAVLLVAIGSDSVSRWRERRLRNRERTGQGRLARLRPGGRETSN